MKLLKIIKKRDFYFYFKDGPWHRLIIGFLLIYGLSILLFGLLFWIRPHSISNAALPYSWQYFTQCFNFSVQTFSTIGYGSISPLTGYANTIVFVESATGFVILAVMTGIIFSKIARPVGKIIFSDHAIITPVNGVQHFMLRIGNLRGNDIVEASVNLSILLEETTQEGVSYRGVYDLPLKRSKTPFFRLTWSLFHKIEPDSELEKLLNGEEHNILAIVASVNGHDSTFNNIIFARHTYSVEQIKIGYRFEDILEKDSAGNFQVRYEDFNVLHKI